MRDPKRITDTLSRIAVAWEKNPDIRLGQLLLNAVRPDGNAYRIREEYDCEWISKLFNIEDEALTKALES